MARKIYKARDRLVRKRVRGALFEENVRTKKRKRVGKTELEQELVREGSIGSDRAENGSGASRHELNNPQRPSHLSVLPDAKKRLRHSAEEAGLLESSENMILDIDETDSASAGDDLRPAEKRQRLKVGERHRDQERRDADANEETSMKDVTDTDHGTSPPYPVNLKKQSQRKQAEAFRQVQKDAEEAAESFEEITGAEIQRTSDLASSRKASRLNHSVEDSGMVHGAGRLVKMGVALASTPAVQAAKRSVSDAGEDNAAIQAAADGTAIAQRTARYSAYHHSTNHASKRNANVHESALRGGEGIRSESIKATEHAAQTEHKKKEQIRAFQKKKRQRASTEAKRRETSIVTAGGFADSVNSMFTAPKKAKEAAKSFFSEHKGTIIGVCVAGILFALFALALSSGASLVHGSGTSVISTTYVSTDEVIYASENAYCALEDGLNGQVNALQSTHSGYDEYECQIDEIEHNPYYLISYLQVKYGGFAYDDGIKAEINRLFRQQYTLSVSEKSETRTRMETVTEMRPIADPDTGEVRMEPYEYEQEVEYEYRTLYAVLTNRNFDIIARANMTEEEIVLYNALNRTYGNRP